MEFHVNHGPVLLSELLFESAQDVPAKVVRTVIRDRSVKIDGQRIAGDCMLKAGQRVTVYWPREYLRTLQREAQSLEVIYEDQHILVINKPYGLLSQSEEGQGTGNNARDRVAAYLKAKGEEADCLALCHRLDVMTGGLLLFAKDAESAEEAFQAFENRTIEKYYTCEVKGTPSRAEAVLHAYLRKDGNIARVSITDYPAVHALPISTGYRVLSDGDIARLEVHLLTGRTHQIRAHLAHIGHPILGDDKYGDRALNRQMGVRWQRLWATRLIFHTAGVLSYLEGLELTVPYPYNTEVRRETEVRDHGQHTPDRH